MNEVVIPLKIQGIAQMKAELRELKGSIASATDPAQMAALAQQAGVLSDKIKDANEAVAVFASGSKFEQVSNGLGGIKDSLMSLDFEEAAEKSKTFATALGGINKTDITKSLKGMTETAGTLGKAFLKLGAQILVNPFFYIPILIVAIIAAIALVLKSFGKLDDVIKALMAPVNALIAGFKSLTDWLGLTSFAAEDNAEKTAAANKRVSESSKAREAQVVGDLGREIAELKAAGKETAKQEEEVSNTKIKEANVRKAKAKEEQDSIKDLDGKFYDDKRLELKKQVDAENEIIKQANSDKVVAKNSANKKEIDDLATDNKEAAAKQKAANDKYVAADKESMEQIAAARKIVTDSAKTAQQIELDDLAAAYAVKIATATKYKNDTTALIDGQKIQEAEINKKYSGAAKAIEDEKKAKKKEEDAKAIIDAIAFEDAKYLELVRLRDGQAEFDKLKLQQEFDEKTAKLKEDDELFLLYKKEFQDKVDAIDIASIEKIKAEKQKSRDEEMASIKGGLDTATDALNSINSLASIGMEAKLKGVKKGSKEEEKILKQQFKQQKAMQLAMAAINGAQAILAILTVPDFTLGVASAIRIGAAVTATAASIATIAGTQFGGSASAPNAPDVGGAGASTTAVAPAAAPQLFGQANTGSQVNAGGGSNNITVTAIVSETEITSSQNHINNIQQNSVL
jgi:hypothetical protein